MPFSESFHSLVEIHAQQRNTSIETNQITFAIQDLDMFSAYFLLKDLGFFPSGVPTMTNPPKLSNKTKNNEK